MVSRKQIKYAIKILENAVKEDFKEFKENIAQTLEYAKREIAESEIAYKMLSEDQGKSLSAHQFDDVFFKNLEVKHTTSVKNFITNWITKQSDWRFAWCWLCRNHVDYTPLSVKSHLVYICTKFHDIHNLSAMAHQNYQVNADSFLNRVRLKPLNDQGYMYDIDVPFNQIGTLVSLDYFPYLSWEQIKNYIKSIKKVLRPGGQALIHFSDGDLNDEWQQVIARKITYCNQEMIKDFARSLNLQTNFYHIDSMYSFVVLTKSGDKTSIKGHMTKIEKL